MTRNKATPESCPGFHLTAFPQTGTVRSVVQKNHGLFLQREDDGHNPVFQTFLPQAQHTAPGTCRAMKHQYFGDTRDLFKYDLLARLVLGMPDIFRILVIPMLTADDDSTEGGRTRFRDSHAGYRNASLRRFLSDHHASGNIARIADYFGEIGIGVDIFAQPFSTGGRSSYFASAARLCTGLPGSLIFLDPDIGLEVKQPDEKHLLFSELREICRAAESPSLLMVYQHIPRVCRETYIEFRLAQLRKCCRRSPFALADRQVVFFLLPTADIEDSALSVLRHCAGDYPVLRCWS